MAGERSEWGAGLPRPTYGPSPTHLSDANEVVNTNQKLMDQEGPLYIHLHMHVCALAHKNAHTCTHTNRFLVLII